MNHFFLNNVHTKMSALSGRRLSKKGRREKSTITILGLQSRCHWVEMEASRGSPAWVPSSNQGSKHCVLLWAFLAVQAEFLHLKSSPTNYLSVAWCFISPTSQEVGEGRGEGLYFPDSPTRLGRSHLTALYSVDFGQWLSVDPNRIRNW